MRETTGSYTVQRNDTLWDIARGFSISLESLCEANGLSRRSVIRPGQRLRIPEGASSPRRTKGNSDRYASTYEVRSGDTLSDIARNHGISTSALKRANGLSSSRIYPGKVLRVPESKAAAPNPPPRTTDAPNTYRVQKGDTLYDIAIRFGVSISELRRANALSSSRIYPGDVLRIPAKNARVDTAAFNSPQNRSFILNFTVTIPRPDRVYGECEWQRNSRSEKFFGSVGHGGLGSSRGVVARGPRRSTGHRSNELLEVRRLVWKAGRKNLARTLLELLADSLETTGSADLFVRTLRELTRLSDGRPTSELLERVTSSLSPARSGNPSLKAVLAHHDIVSARRPVEELDTIERWLDHDVGTAVEVVGQGVGRVVDLNLELGKHQGGHRHQTSDIRSYRCRGPISEAPPRGRFQTPQGRGSRGSGEDRGRDPGRRTGSSARESRPALQRFRDQECAGRRPRHEELDFVVGKGPEASHACFPQARVRGFATPSARAPRRPTRPCSTNCANAALSEKPAAARRLSDRGQETAGAASRVLQDSLADMERLRSRVGVAGGGGPFRPARRF